ncbi:nuclear transport factor 2 family protein [Paenarthrobacter sp. PH39-S1]|uniref:nuclear transport factor 2 family protein n=1 Tax=Paenarthrobacter sp. PH39-S1 TaxID=3046204 RepID=UPI0024BBBC50|nr:nuclear transport factor 2 family protein [Paenarthrobacter sp. PH39-S1]MDJ0356655.1 nuclear transport factor 2 family protein [Paenarthrobacter sp. PH39-S1]
MKNVIDAPFSSHFSAEWVDAWNAHDVERVLSHFRDDVKFTSPLAAKLIEGSDGTLCGKVELRNYWLEGVKQNPDLKFTIENVYTGIETIVINYRNQNGKLANEVLTFKDGLIIEGHGTYLGQGDEDTFVE